MSQSLQFHVLEGFRVTFISFLSQIQFQEN